ncbi:MAG: hypothetical protein K6G42_05045 [Lachnospiraceae bacterium]|nr:hypothetical protein [Lachnospiraceae bacterium]
MTYSSRNTSYKIVSTVLSSEINDCYIAVSEETEDGREYTLVVLKEHESIRTLMEILSGSRTISDSALIESFTYGQSYVMVFPYRQKRPLDTFFVGDAYTLTRCEDICTNILLSCISSGLPYPLMYLILDQGHVNLAKDDSVYFSYDLDLCRLDRTKTERDCAVRCADILLNILASKSEQKNISYELLSKKSANNSYSHFTELYRDLRIAATPVKKRSIIVRIKSFFYRNADNLFGILFWICLILAVVALVMLFTHLVWGDIPFLRLFFNSFKKIGTESLVQ